MDLELILAGVLAAVVALLIAAQFLRIPYPILLVVGGLAVGFIPGMPSVELDPDLVLVILLPPLLYAAAFFTPLRALRQNVRPIGILAVGLVLATMVAVAAAAHFALDFGWEEAFVLGAIVAPTDPVAATAIARRLGLPSRIVTIVEGEALINDATALVAYKFAVAAVVTGSFSLADAGLHIVVDAAAGVGIGIAVGAVVAWIRSKLDNPPVEITIALFTSYFAYLPAEAAGASGVLAAVTVGIFMGRLTSRLTGPTTRLQGNGVWEILVFLVNSALFMLIGLQLPTILDGLADADVTNLIRDGALIAAVVIATRILWVFPLTYLPSLLWGRGAARPPWRNTLIVAWTGMRGAVSLAAALAVPLTIEAGGDFPNRDLIIFLAFSVILATLLLQGLTLPPLIAWLGLEEDPSEHREEEIMARRIAAQAAIHRVDELAEEEWVRDDTAERVRGLYEYRLRRLRAQDGDGDGEDYERRSRKYQKLVREVLEAQRGALLELRARGEIDDDTLRAIEYELDLEDSRLEI